MRVSDGKRCECLRDVSGEQELGDAEQTVAVGAAAARLLLGAEA